MPIAILPDRGVLEVTGEDRVAFLQGLVSNDVALAAPGQAVFAALLTPQGKWLAEFFILTDGERLLLDCEQAQAAMLAQRLARFRLRSRVALRDLSAELAVVAGWAMRPRRPARCPIEYWRKPGGGRAGCPARDRCDRRGLGPPPAGARPAGWQPRSGGRAEAACSKRGYDELHGVSWTKGCYMGEELTARTKHSVGC